jgi:hypothetical protein
MIRRPIIWRPQSRSAPTATPLPGPGRRLTRHWPAVPRHARQAARRSSPERTAPAIASSRNVRTGKARQPGLPGLPGTPRRPRARTDHTSHSSPATCRSVAGSRPPQLHHIDCSPRQSAVPARPLTATGHYRPAQSWPAAPVPSSRLGDVALRRPTRPAPGPGVPRGYHPRIPSLIQSGRSRARYRPGPQCAARDQRQRETPPSAPCRQIETPAPARTGVIIAALCRLSKIRSLSSGGIMPDHACDRGAARLDLGASRSQAYQPNEDYPWWVRFLAWLGDGCRPGFPPAG